SHLDAKDGRTLTVNGPPRVAWRTSWPAWASCWKAERTGDRKVAPASVSFRDRAPRSNSGWPTHSSSALIWWLMALWVTLSSSAALEKLRCRAALSKYQTAFKGGMVDMVLL